MKPSVGKVTSLAEAAALVPDGAVIGIGGNSQSRKPMALLRELIRSGRRDLEVVTFLGSIDVDLLIACERVRRVRAGYVGFDLLGVAPNHASAASGLLQVETEASIIMGLLATTAHVGSLPARGALATDVPTARPDVRTIACPYRGEELIVWPAIDLDVALVHVPWADTQGNAVLSGAPVIDHLLTEAATTTILTAERVVAPAELPARADLYGHRVHAVAAAPFGAHPTACHPWYRVDLPFLAGYADHAADGTLGAQLESLFESDHDGYVRQVVEPARSMLEVRS